jgi:ubiquinone/menaquinone biosynthesis C-methylase UbiE
MERKLHWENIYKTKASTQVSWYREHLQMSLKLIEQSEVDNSAHIIDVGGGASTLVDDLLKRGFKNITVLDVSSAAIGIARKRLGSEAEDVKWIEADVTQATLPHNYYDVWHDRAVFHFLTGTEDRKRYVDAVKHSLKAGGNVIIATFAPDGPPRCSGLDVVRFSPDSLHEELGNDFKLMESAGEVHQTPFGTQQKFVYCHFRKHRKN